MLPKATIHGQETSTSRRRSGFSGLQNDLQDEQLQNQDDGIRASGIPATVTTTMSTTGGVTATTSSSTSGIVSAFNTLASESDPSPRDLWNVFGWNESNLRNMPSRAKREGETKFNDLPPPQRSTALQAVVRGLLRIVEIVYPGDPDALLAAVIDKAAKKTHQPTPAMADKNLDNMVRAMLAAPRGSVELRVLRAALCSAYPRAAIKDALPAASKLSICSNTFTAARHDFDELLQGHSLASTKHTRARFNPAQIDAAVSFILSEQYVGPLTWGWRKVPLNGFQEAKVPAFVRNVSKTHMYQQYAVADVGQDMPKLSRSTIFELISMLTTGQELLLSQTDLATVKLVHENLHRAERMIIQFIANPQEQKYMLRMKAVLANFLENQYIQHAVKESGDVEHSHSLSYGLNISKEHALRNQARCNACRLVPYFFSKLKDHVRTTLIVHEDVSTESLLKQVEVLHGNTQAYMAHKIRTANQQVALLDLHQEMKHQCENERNTAPKDVIIVAGFKQNFTPGARLHKNEPSRRSICWHACMLIWYQYNPLTFKADRQAVFCDQIVRDTVEKDESAGIILLEALFTQLKRDFPSVQNIILQTNCSVAYNSRSFAAALPLLARHVGLNIHRHITSEVSCLTGVLGLHVAQASQIVETYLAGGKCESVSPEQVYAALSQQATSNNSSCQLLHINKEKLNSFFTMCSSLIARLPPYQRYYDVEYQFDNTFNDNVQRRRPPRQPQHQHGPQRQEPEINSTYDFETVIRARRYSRSSLQSEWVFNLARQEFSQLSSDASEDGEEGRLEDEITQSLFGNEMASDSTLLGREEMINRNVVESSDPALDSGEIQMFFGAKVVRSTPFVYLKRWKQDYDFSSIAESTTFPESSAVNSASPLSPNHPSNSRSNDPSCLISSISPNAPLDENAGLSRLEKALIISCTSVTGHPVHSMIDLELDNNLGAHDEASPVEIGPERSSLAGYVLPRVEEKFRADGPLAFRVRDNIYSPDQPEYQDTESFNLTDLYPPGWARQSVSDPRNSLFYDDPSKPFGISLDPFTKHILQSLESGEGAGQEEKDDPYKAAQAIFEELEARYPFRMDLPSSSDINNEIQRLAQMRNENKYNNDMMAPPMPPDTHASTSVPSTNDTIRLSSSLSEELSLPIKKSPSLVSPSIAGSSATKASENKRVRQRRMDKRYVDTINEAIAKGMDKARALAHFHAVWGADEQEWAALGENKPAFYPDDRTIAQKYNNQRQMFKRQAEMAHSLVQASKKQKQSEDVNCDNDDE